MDLPLRSNRNLLLHPSFVGLFRPAPTGYSCAPSQKTPLSRRALLSNKFEVGRSTDDAVPDKCQLGSRLLRNRALNDEPHRAKLTQPLMLGTSFTVWGAEKLTSC